MREEIRDTSGNLLGWKDKSGDTTHVYTADGSYKGYSNSTGTFCSSAGKVYSGDNPNLLLR